MSAYILFQLDKADNPSEHSGPEENGRVHGLSQGTVAATSVPSRTDDAFAPHAVRSVIRLRGA